MLRRHETSLRVMFERYSDGAPPGDTMCFDEWKVSLFTMDAHAMAVRILSLRLVDLAESLPLPLTWGRSSAPTWVSSMRASRCGTPPAASCVAACRRPTSALT